MLQAKRLGAFDLSVIDYRLGTARQTCRHLGLDAVRPGEMDTNAGPLLTQEGDRIEERLRIPPAGVELAGVEKIELTGQALLFGRAVIDGLVSIEHYVGTTSVKTAEVVRQRLRYGHQSCHPAQSHTL